MDDAEIDDLIERIVELFLPRVPPRYVDGFESMMDAGEYALAVDDLVATLVVENVPVTPAERDDLRRLLEATNEPTDRLDRLTLAVSN